MQVWNWRQLCVVGAVRSPCSVWNRRHGRWGQAPAFEVHIRQVPFERVLGARLGVALKVGRDASFQFPSLCQATTSQDFFESKGIKFMGGKVAAEIKQNGSALQAVLKTGEVLNCDSIVVGVGVVPNADFIEGAQKARDGSLVTNECLKTTAEGLFAAGDVCTYKSSAGSNMRVEHWDVATSQGRIAAKNMLGKDEKFDQTPFFWTSLFGKNLRYVGHCTEFDELLVEAALVGPVCARKSWGHAALLLFGDVCRSLGSPPSRNIMPTRPWGRSPTRINYSIFLKLGNACRRTLECLVVG